ncbi:MAG: hypothetical protein PVF68_14230, partial [Acidobacteriota bacterium]
RNGWIGLLLLSLAGGSLLAQPAYYVVPGLPASPGPTSFGPNEIVVNASGSYAVVWSLPPGIAIDALYRLSTTEWLFSVASPTVLGGIAVEPRDLVIRGSGGTYSLFVPGSAIGIPARASIDAVHLGVDLLLSFDVPVVLDGIAYDPADVVRYDVGTGTYSVLFDASAVTPPLLTSRNVTGVAQVDGLTILTFDLPTTVGGSSFLPGQLAAWDGAGLTLYDSPPGWPTYTTRLNALAFAPSFLPGSVDGLLVDHGATPEAVALSWTAGCSDSGQVYEVYEGTIGTWYDHGPVDCGTLALAHEYEPAAGNRYFLVVPRNGDLEGSYGRDASGLERPRSATACAAEQDLGCP